MSRYEGFKFDPGAGANGANLRDGRSSFDKSAFGFLYGGLHKSKPPKSPRLLSHQHFHQPQHREHHTTCPGAPYFHPTFLPPTPPLRISPHSLKRLSFCIVFVFSSTLWTRSPESTHTMENLDQYHRKRTYARHVMKVLRKVFCIVFILC